MVIANFEGSTNGAPSLIIDTHGNQKSHSQKDAEWASKSQFSSAQLRKLDLQSALEDDTSSETSSASNSKQQPTTAGFSNLFSPRSSMDVTDRDSILRPLQTRPLSRSPLGRSASAKVDALIMGFVQIQGSFVIDEALIHASEFDDIKTRAVMGGKSGGGVVGMDSHRTTSWTGLSSLGSLSLGSLFGTNSQSSLADMRNRATSKSVPILLTPPSLLFVDVRLLPGESRSFTYRYKLPRNLPPSHRGRALRISYSLVITTQRPGKTRQLLSTTEIPFRVFSYLDGNIIDVKLAHHRVGSSAFV